MGDLSLCVVEEPWQGHLKFEIETSHQKSLELAGEMAVYECLLHSSWYLGLELKFLELM